MYEGEGEAAMKRKHYDMTQTKRIAAFVKGRQGIPRELFTAAFPKVQNIVVSLLSEMGHLEPAPPRAASPNLVAAREALVVRRRVAKVERLERQLAEARAKVTP